MLRCHALRPSPCTRAVRQASACLLGLGLHAGAALAQYDDGVEFDARFLHRAPGAAAIDLRRFSNGNGTPPGRYLADVVLNDEPKGRQDIQFLDRQGEPGPGTVLCVPPALIDSLDLRPEALARPLPTDGCAILAETVPQAQARFELSTQKLYLEVPQALLTVRPRGYVSPALWSAGVPAAFLQYDLNHYRYRYREAQHHNTYLGLRGGLNLGGWTLRHRSALQWSERRTRHYQGIETYLQRDLSWLRGQMTLGDFYTHSRLTDSVNLRGIRLASDDRMLPGSLQGYAPVVRGIAESTARLTIRQGGHVIYETTVPAGPFVINDLYPSGYGGDLEVTLTEADGRSRTFHVPFASVAELIRPGYARYQIAAGRYRDGQRQWRDTVFQSSLQYGLLNDVTLNTALTLAPRYRAGLLGAAFNTRIGALAADITVARAVLRDTGTAHTGYSLHASYSTRVPSTETYFSLAAYRYSSSEYYSLRDTLWRNRAIAVASHEALPYLDWRQRPRHHLQVSINQRLPQGWGSLYLSGSTIHYWNHPGRRNEYQAGYNHQYGRLSYQIGYSQSRDLYTQNRDHRLFLTLSIPLGLDLRRPLLSATLSRNTHGGRSIQSSVSGVLGDDNDFSYSLSASRQTAGQASYGLNSHWRTSLARWNASASMGSDRSRQLSAGASGAIVVHPKGVTLSNELSDTFAIIHAPGAQGAAVRQGSGNRVDAFGNGIVPFVSPYQRNLVGLDPTDLPLDVSLAATEQEIVPRANSATLIRFETESALALLFDIALADGGAPPMTADVYDEEGRFIGFVAQAGRLFTQGLAPQGRLTVSWGVGPDMQRCRFEYDASAVPTGTRTPTVQPVVCRPEGSP